MLHNIPDEILDFCYSRLGGVISFETISGGCINHGGRLETRDGLFFIKWNTTFPHRGMFEAEKKGLDLLASAKVLSIPTVQATFKGSQYSCILMEFMKSASPSEHFSESLGRGLAELHKNSSDFFGLDQDNYIGSLVQYNHQEKSWIDFFKDHRIMPQLRLGIENGRIDLSHSRQFERLIDQLPSLLTVERPSLVHGDLWNGNVITNETGMPCLIDPAVAYAHRETDLAMTRLFGGFDQKFYEVNEAVFPTEPGLEDRIEIYLLYPLLVHVNLFGGSYLEQAMRIVNRFVG